MRKEYFSLYKATSFTCESKQHQIHGIELSEKTVQTFFEKG